MGFVDLSCLPMTYEVRDRVYARSEELVRSFTTSGVWDRAFSLTELLEMLDAAGIERVLVPAHHAGEWEVPYELVAEMAAAHPDRISGQAGIDPRDIVAGVRRLEQGIREYGFVGAHSYPHWFGLAPDDRAYYPFYAKCVELDVPIQIQVGKAWQGKLRSVAHPSTIDSVAVDFPDLRVVAIHTGHPWERELVAVASKHANVFIGADSLPPAEWARELVDYLANVSSQPVMAGREKVLFGTNYPALSGLDTFAEAVQEVRDLRLADDVFAALMGGNARRVYGLPGRD